MKSKITNFDKTDSGYDYILTLKTVISKELYGEPIVILIER